MTDSERYAHMRDTALGRVQAASDLRLRATEMLCDAIRTAAKAEADPETLSIESGLPVALIHAVIAGHGVRELMLEVAA